MKEIMNMIQWLSMTTEYNTSSSVVMNIKYCGYSIAAVIAYPDESLTQRIERLNEYTIQSMLYNIDQINEMQLNALENESSER